MACLLPTALGVPWRFARRLSRLRANWLIRTLLRVLLPLATLMGAQPAWADWFYYRTDAVQTNTPPIGMSVDAYCEAEYASWRSQYGSSLQSRYLPPDPTTRPAAAGSHEGELRLTAGNCRHEIYSPYSSPPQWLTGSFASFNVAWAWCDGSAEWIPERLTCTQPEDASCTVGNPVQPGTGREAYSETDYTGAGTHPLEVKRQYRSLWIEGVGSAMAATGARQGGWMLSMQTRLFDIPNRMRPLRRITRPDGRVVSFHGDPVGVGPRTWTSSDGSGDQLLEQRDSAGVLSGWQYKIFADDSVETYDMAGALQSIRQRNGWTTTLTYSTASTPVAAYLSGSSVPQAGLLISVKNHFGRELRLIYDAQGRVTQLLPPGAVKDNGPGDAASPIRYAYDEPVSLGGTAAQSQLTSVVWQDGSVKRYHYEDGRLPQALTGTTDEAGVRTSTRRYHSSGVVTEEYRASGVDRVLFRYTDATRTAPAQTTITDHSGPNGSATTRTYTFQSIGGVMRPTAVSAPCPLCGSTQASTSYDASGNATRTIAHDGQVTFYAYDAKGREIERATFPSRYQSATTRPALSAATSVTSTQWHATWRLPTQVAEPGKLSSYGYDAKGNLTGQSWTTTTDATGAQGFAATASGSTYATGWAYDGNSLPISIVEQTGATETGRWTLGYNASGDVTSVTDVTRGNLVGRATQYDVHGRMLAGTTDAGVALGFTYSPRGFYATKTVGGQTVTFAQNPIGLTTEVRMPDNQVLGYVYDAAHRLTDIRLNGASITPAMLAKAEYPDTFTKATGERARVLLRGAIEALLPSAFAQVPMPTGGLRPVLVLPGQPMPGQPEFDPRTDLMTMAPMSASDKAARNLAERWARLCECKPEGGYERPTFTAVSFAHVLFSGHLSPSFSDKSYFAPTEAVGQTLVDEVMAHGQEVPSGDPNRVVVAAVLTRPLGSVGYARTSTGAFVPTNKVRLVYERTHCSSRFRGRNEVVTIYPE